jgi:hypothetical protein
MKRERSLIFLVLGLAACSYTFDANAPGIPLVGVPPEMKRLPRLNTAPVDGEAFTRGADGHLWLVMSQNDKTWRAASMHDPGKFETIKGDEVYVTGNALYITKNLNANMPNAKTLQIELTVRNVLEQPGHMFILPANGAAILLSGGNDEVFAYVVADPAVPGYILQRRDGRFYRVVHWPKGVDPVDPFANPNVIFFFDAGFGATFYDRDDDGRIVGHHTMDNIDIDLGIRPRTLGWLDDHTLITCGRDGVRLVPVDGKTPETVLDNDICLDKLLWVNNGHVYYEVGTVVRKTKLDGSAPPETVYDFVTNRVLRIAPTDDTILYSTDPAGRYVHDAGDGWLKGWKFMNRGSNITFTDDRKSIYWLESSAQGSGAGELTMVTLPGAAIPGGTPRPLARNVRDYSILGDGRILCNDNYAFSGTFNRLILVDPKKGKSQWFADGANHWSLFNSSKEAIVDVVTGATSGHDVVRMTLPPPLP